MCFCQCPHWPDIKCWFESMLVYFLILSFFFLNNHMHLYLWIKIHFFPLHLKKKIKGSFASVNLYFLPESVLCSSGVCQSQACLSKVLNVFKVYVRVPACASVVAVSSDRRCKVGGGLWFPVLSWRLSQFVRVRKGKQKQKRKTAREWRREKSCSPRTTSPSSASVLSLVFIVFLLFAVRQRGTGADLPVAIQPLLHHLGDEWVVAAAGAFLKSHQDPALRHTAVQPLPQQLLLLLFITHLKEKQMWPLDGTI